MGGNIEMLRGLYDDFARRDLDGLEPRLAPDVEFVNPEYAVEGGVRQGPKEFRQALEGLLDLFDYETNELSRIVESGDQVLVEYHTTGSAKGSRAPIDVRLGHLWTVHGGKVMRLEWFSTYNEAVDAARLEKESGDSALVRRLYQLWEAGAYEEAIAAVDPAIEWVEPPDAPESDTHVGAEGILFSADRWLSGFEAWSMEIERIRDLGSGKVLVEIQQRGRGRGSSVDVEAMVFHLWTVRESRAMRMQMFLSEPEAIAAADASRPEDHA